MFPDIDPNKFVDSEPAEKNDTDQFSVSASVGSNSVNTQEISTTTGSLPVIADATMVDTSNDNMRNVERESNEKIAFPSSLPTLNASQVAPKKTARYALKSRSMAKKNTGLNAEKRQSNNTYANRETSVWNSVNNKDEFIVGKSRTAKKEQRKLSTDLKKASFFTKRKQKSVAQKVKVAKPGTPETVLPNINKGNLDSDQLKDHDVAMESSHDDQVKWWCEFVISIWLKYSLYS